MARRRMIDPNIWASEDMSKLTIRQRLLVIGLFSNADDHGKGIAKPPYIRSMVFPYDDIPIPDIIDDLETVRAVISIHFYEVEGNSYYKFYNWVKWQRVDKPQPSIIPEPFENHSGMIPEPLLPKGKEEKRKEGKGKEAETANVPSGNAHEDRLLKLMNDCELEEMDIYPLEQIFSYIGMVEIEVIEVAIKKASKKHINYALRTLEGMIKEGKTTKESIKHLQAVPDKPKKTDPELESRNMEIARSRWIQGGGKPDEFRYNTSTGS